jgi:transcriptional regulator with XRE-family HTH domain
MNNRLREIRVVKRITQFQLRLLTGIHQSKISLIENDLITPGKEEMKKLAQVLGAKPEDLFPANGDHELVNSKNPRAQSQKLF